MTSSTTEVSKEVIERHTMTIWGKDHEVTITIRRYLYGVKTHWEVIAEAPHCFPQHWRTTSKKEAIRRYAEGSEKYLNAVRKTIEFWG